jgi:hypothetical protein
MKSILGIALSLLRSLLIGLQIIFESKINDKIARKIIEFIVSSRKIELKIRIC